MRKILAFYGRLVDATAFALKAVGFAAIVAIVAAITLQVVSRYVFGRPHLWVEEAATYCFIWLVFIGAAYSMVKKRHIIVTSITDLLPESARKVFRIGAYLIVLFFLFFLIRFGLRQFAIEAPQKTIALPVRLPRRWFYSLPLVISAFSMFFTSVYQLLEEIFAGKGEEKTL